MCLNLQSKGMSEIDPKPTLTDAQRTLTDANRTLANADRTLTNAKVTLTDVNRKAQWLRKKPWLGACNEEIKIASRGYFVRIWLRLF